MAGKDSLVSSVGDRGERKEATLPLANAHLAGKRNVDARRQAEESFFSTGVLSNTWG